MSTTHLTQILLGCRNLSYVTPAGRILFDSLNFDVESSRLTLITGPNGSGKSTLLQLLLKRLPLQDGQIISSIDPKQIAYIPQLANMHFHLPVTLRDVIYISDRRNYYTEEITSVGLLSPSYLDHAWNTASGGERQRVLLTAALLRKPKLLVLDEPFNHLDAETQKNMLRSISGFIENGGGALLVSHLATDELKQADIPMISIELGAR